MGNTTKGPLGQHGHGLKGGNLSSKLDKVADWGKLAGDCRFQLREMARQQNVTERHLRRYLKKVLNIKAKTWIDQERLLAGLSCLQNGDRVKEAANEAEFKHAQNFSKFVKRKTGNSPTHFKARE